MGGGGSKGGKRKKEKLETAKAIAKFKDGRGFYWQCSHCGTVRDECTPACSTSTFSIKLDATGEQVLRFSHDVSLADVGVQDDEYTIFIGRSLETSCLLYVVVGLRARDKLLGARI